jgi:hypothetical protein
MAEVKEWYAQRKDRERCEWDWGGQEIQWAMEADDTQVGTQMDDTQRLASRTCQSGQSGHGIAYACVGGFDKRVAYGYEFLDENEALIFTLQTVRIYHAAATAMVDRGMLVINGFVGTGKTETQTDFAGLLGFYCKVCVELNDCLRSCKALTDSATLVVLDRAHRFPVDSIVSRITKSIAERSADSSSRKGLFVATADPAEGGLEWLESLQHALSSTSSSLSRIRDLRVPPAAAGGWLLVGALRTQHGLTKRCAENLAEVFWEWLTGVKNALEDPAHARSTVKITRGEKRARASEGKRGDSSFGVVWREVKRSDSLFEVRETERVAVGHVEQGGFADSKAVKNGNLLCVLDGQELPSIQDVRRALANPNTDTVLIFHAVDSTVDLGFGFMFNVLGNFAKLRRMHVQHEEVKSRGSAGPKLNDTTIRSNQQTTTKVKPPPLHGLQDGSSNSSSTGSGSSSNNGNEGGGGAQTMCEHANVVAIHRDDANPAPLPAPHGLSGMESLSEAALLSLLFEAIGMTPYTKNEDTPLSEEEPSWLTHGLERGMSRGKITYLLQEHHKVNGLHTMDLLQVHS